MKHLIVVSAAALALCACGGPSDSEPPAQPAAAATPAATAAPMPSEGASLAAALDAQPDSVKARYQYRHPRETLEFFDVKPGMTVIEALPGGGWYSKILLPYLGENGRLIGADYAVAMWAKFGFMKEEGLKKKETWPQDWTAKAEVWRNPGDASVAAFALGSLPDDLAGTVDAVLFIRALHNMARFENDGGFLSAAIDDAFTALKPGGIAGVVQHQARDDMPDAWAKGDNGYLKKDYVIAAMEKAGFEYLGAIDINANDKDQPTTDDIVWRLPPSLDTSRDDAELRAQLKAVGESNRMTLKFRKPAG